MTTDTLKSFDPVWEKIFQEQEWGKYPSEWVIRFVARNFYQAPDRKKIKLLDLGCGPGACTWFMAREGFDVSSIDGSATAIDRLNKRLASEGLSADARVGDIVSLPWADGTFDGVIDNGCLCCNSFASCQRTVSEVLRVLKPGGVFLSANFTDRTWGYGDGETLGMGEFRDLKSGTIANKGFILFMGRGQVDQLYAPFARTSVETAAYTLNEMKNLVELWIVTAKK